MFSIVLSVPVGGQREHKFQTALQLAEFIHANCPYMFAKLKGKERTE